MADETNNGYVFKVEADTSEADRNLDATSKKLDEINQKAEKADNTLNNMGKSMDSAANTSGMSKMLDEMKSAYSDLENMGEQYAETMRNMGNDSGAQQIEQEFQKIGQQIDDVINKTSNLSSGFNEAKSSANELTSVYDVLSQRAERLNDTMAMMDDFQAPKGIYTQLEKDIQSAENELIKYLEKQDEMVSKGVDTNSEEWQRLQQNIDTATEHVTELSARMEDLRDSGEGFSVSMTPDYAAEERQLQELYDLYDRTEAKKQEFQELGFKGEALETAYKDVDAELEKISQDISEIIEKQDQMVQSGTAFKPANDTSSYERYNEQLYQTNQQMQQLQQNTLNVTANTQQLSITGDKVENTWEGVTSSIISSASKSNSAVYSVASSLNSITGIASAVAVGIGSVFSAINNVMDRYSQDLQQEMDLYQYIVSGSMDKIKSSITSIASKITQAFGQKAQQAVKKFSDGLKKVTKNLLGLGEQTNIVKKAIDELTGLFEQFYNTLKSQIMRAAVRLILDDLEEDLVTMAKYSEEFNEVMSDLINSGAQLGMQLVAAFEPILDIVIPWITQFINWLDEAMVYITQFTSALTGRDYYYEAAKGNENYADSLDDTTESTEKATQATQSFQSALMGFDQLNKLTGSNGGTLGGLQDTLDAMTVDDAALKKMKEQANDITGIAKDIFECINNDDWFGAGRKVGEAVLEAFGWLDDALGWEQNAERFTEIVNQIIDLINGLIDFFIEDNGTNAKLLGKYIGDMLNTLIEVFKMLLDPETGINFEGLGEAIGYALVAACEEINWYDLGKLVAEYMQMIPTILSGLFATDIGTALGEGLAEGLKGFADSMDVEMWDKFFEGLFNNIFDFIIALFNDTDTFFEIGEKLGEMLTSVVNGLISETEGGESKLGKALDGIFTALGVAINGFITGLDVSAESIETLVYNVIHGIITGFTTLLNSSDDEQKTIADTLGEFIAGAIAGVADTFEDNDWVNLADSIINSILSILSKVFSNPDDFAAIGEGLANTINQAITSLGEGITYDENSGEFSGTLDNMIKSIVNLISNLLLNIDWGGLSDTIILIMEDIFDQLDASNFLDCIDGIVQLFTDIFVEAAERLPLGDILETLKDGINQIVTSLAKSMEEEYMEGTAEAIAEAMDEKNWKKAFTNALASSGSVGKYFAQWFTDIGSAKTLAKDYNYGSFFKNLKMLRQSDETYGSLINTTKNVDEALMDMVNTASDSAQSVAGSESDMSNSWVNATSAAVDAASNISSNFEASGSSFQKLSEYVNDATSNISDSSVTVTSTLSDSSEEWGSLLNSTAGGFFSLSEDSADAMNTMADDIDTSTEEQKGIFERFNDWLGNTFGVKFNTTLMDTLSGTEDTVDDTLEYTDTVFGEIADSTLDMSSDVNGYMTELLTNTDAQQVDLVGIMTAMILAILNLFTNLTNNVATSTDGFVVEFEDTFYRLMQAVQKMCLQLDQYLTQMKKSIQDFYADTTASFPSVTSSNPFLAYSIPALAGGGVVGDGQLFLANENGAEMITSSNGNTTVTNNEQMVQAITTGVYNAVRDAMNNNNTVGGNDNGDIVIYVDSEELARASINGMRSINKRTNPVVSFV